MKDRKRLPTHIQAKLRNAPTQYFRTTLYALYKRNLIEDWLAGMEKGIETLEKLFQTEMEIQTAGHFNTIDQDTMSEVESMKEFLESINALAKAIDGGTLASHATASAHDWALGLRSREKLNDIDNWRSAQIKIELSFSGPRSLKERMFWMQVCHNCPDRRQPLDRHQIEHVVLGQLNKKSPSAVPGVECYPQYQGTRRTRPLGTLFAEKPNLFLDQAWKCDRVGLIHGLSNWVLLLWDSI